MSTNNATKEGLVVRAQQLSAGGIKHLGSQTQITFTGGSYTPLQITTKLASVVTLRADVNAAKAMTRAKVATETAGTPSLRAFVDAFTAYVKATFGDQPEVLADFGVSLKTRAPLTVEQKTAAAAKRASTRKARGTTGPKAKKAVKGNVVGVNVTPVTSTVTPASPAPVAVTPPRTAS